MTSRLALTLALTGLFFAGTAIRAGEAAPQTWDGMISDSQCGGDHGGEIDVRECTLKCTSQGDKYVLVIDRGTKVVAIANQTFADLPKHAGHTVRVTGELADEAITIAKIDML
jgi:hypothetical protein